MTLIFLIYSSFSAQLEGDSVAIQPEQCRIVTVSFTPRQEGLCEAVLDLIFHDYMRKANFVIKRTLTGWAKRPPIGRQDHHKIESMHNPRSRSINDEPNYHGGVSFEEEIFLDSDGTGISISHEDGLDFGIVERKRLNGPFATPSSLLTIELAAGFPSVIFVKEKTRILRGGDPECVTSPFRAMDMYFFIVALGS